MDKFDRIHLLHRCLQQARYPVAATTLMEHLECSRPTLSRLIGYMRDFLGAPIESDHHRGGYRYTETTQDRYDLPGLWFSPAELFALVSMPYVRFAWISPAKSRGLISDAAEMSFCRAFQEACGCCR